MDYKKIVQELELKVNTFLKTGDVASYIPELKR